MIFAMGRLRPARTRSSNTASRAAESELATRLYERFIERLRSRGIEVAAGIFQAMMDVELVNDGPVTILLDPPPARKG